MRLSEFIEKHFWIILILGIFFGLWKPVPFKVPVFLPKLLLGLMLFMVFLKIDALEIIENIRNYRLMIYVTIIYMFVIPLLFYLITNSFNHELAIGILLLTSMPAGVSTPALTDIVKGNISLSMSLAIISQLIAPFSVPLLFWLIVSGSVSINTRLHPAVSLAACKKILSSINKEHTAFLYFRKCIPPLLVCLFYNILTEESYSGQYIGTNLENLSLIPDFHYITCYRVPDLL